MNHIAIPSLNNIATILFPLKLCKNISKTTINNLTNINFTIYQRLTDLFAAYPNHMPPIVTFIIPHYTTTAKNYYDDTEIWHIYYVYDYHHKYHHHKIYMMGKWTPARHTLKFSRERTLLQTVVGMHIKAKIEKFMFVRLSCVVS